MATSKRKSLVHLNAVADALSLYQSQLMPIVEDVRGQRIEFDLGSCVHVVDDEELLARILHIHETLANPEEVRRSHHRSTPYREVYINTFYESQEDEIGEPFLVVIDRRPWPMFWACILPEENYLENVKEGDLLWKPSSQ